MTDQLSLSDELAPTEYDMDLAQWYTPPRLAEKIAREFVGPFGYVLEPTAGDGALVRAAVARGAEVDAIEIDPSRREALIESGARQVMTRDFLRTRTERPKKTQAYDLILMNPPDNARLDLPAGEFLQRAILVARQQDCPVVALIRTACLHGIQREQDVWRRVRVTDLRFLSRRPSYSGQPGGGVQDWVVVRMVTDRTRLHRTNIKWWTEQWS